MINIFCKKRKKFFILVGKDNKGKHVQWAIRVNDVHSISYDSLSSELIKDEEGKIKLVKNSKPAVTVVSKDMDKRYYYFETEKSALKFFEKLVNVVESEGVEKL